MLARPWFEVTNEVLEDELIDSGKKRTSACFCSVSVSVVFPTPFNQADSLARPSTCAQKKRPGTRPASVVCSQFGKLNTGCILTLFSLIFLNLGFSMPVLMPLF